MNCEICGSKTSKNHGDSYLVICKKCYEIENEMYLKELRDLRKKSKIEKKASRRSHSDSEYLDYQKKSIKKGLSVIFIILIIPFSILLITKIFSGIGWIGEKAGEKTIEFLGENKSLRETVKKQSRNLGVKKEADNILKDFELAAKNLKVEKQWRTISNQKSFFYWCYKKGYITKKNYDFYVGEIDFRRRNFERPPSKLVKYLDEYLSRN